MTNCFWIQSIRFYVAMDIRREYRNRRSKCQLSIVGVFSMQFLSFCLPEWYDIFTGGYFHIKLIWILFPSVAFRQYLIDSWCCFFIYFLIFALFVVFHHICCFYYYYYFCHLSKIPLYHINSSIEIIQSNDTLYYVSLVFLQCVFNEMLTNAKRHS